MGRFYIPRCGGRHLVIILKVGIYRGLNKILLKPTDEDDKDGHDMWKEPSDGVSQG